MQLNVIDQVIAGPNFLIWNEKYLTTNKSFWSKKIKIALLSKL